MIFSFSEKTLRWACIWMTLVNSHKTHSLHSNEVDFDREINQIITLNSGYKSLGYQNEAYKQVKSIKKASERTLKLWSSSGRTWTYDQLINSQLLYHWATEESFPEWDCNIKLRKYYKQYPWYFFLKKCIKISYAKNS